MLRRTLFLILVLILMALFVTFFLKYVPLITGFQLALLPVLAVVFFLSFMNREWGLLAFVFFFPLINNLPYFFGIYEDIPHAPTALILFMSFLLGWVFHVFFFKISIDTDNRVFKLLLLISILIAVSAVITFSRYSGFFPFKADALYELTVNTEGTKAGGAFMSVVFNSLNYLTGFAFFLILINTLKSKEFIKKVIIALSTSAFLSLGFGFYQHFGDLSLGNLPSKIKWPAIAALNATFKDGNSCGAYLAFFIPFVLGLVFFFKGARKIFFISLSLLAVFILPFTGSISGVIGAVLSSLFVILCSVRMIWPEIKRSPAYRKKVTVYVVSFLFLLAVFTSVIFVSKGSSTYNKLKKRVGFLQKEGEFSRFSANKIDYYWAIAWEMMKNYPVSGLGVGAYIIEISNYAKIMDKLERRSDSAENYFLQIGAELGLFGLVLFLGVFWEILRQLRRCGQRSLYDKRWKFLVVSICGGMISLLISFIFHSYIGSFEIKYAFWLLIGIIFALNRMEEERDRKRFKVRWTEKILGVAILILFTVTLAYNSVRSLSLDSRTRLLSLKQDFGFYEEEYDGEKRFRWAGEKAGFSITAESPVMTLTMLASHPDIKKRPVSVDLRAIKGLFEEKAELGIVTIRDRNWHEYSLRIPQPLLGQELILILRTDRTWQPFKEQGTPDLRRLGIALGDVRFVQPAEKE